MDSTWKIEELKALPKTQQTKQLIAERNEIDELVKHLRYEAAFIHYSALASLPSNDVLARYAPGREIELAQALKAKNITQGHIQGLYAKATEAFGEAAPEYVRKALTPTGAALKVPEPKAGCNSCIVLMTQFIFRQLQAFDARQMEGARNRRRLAKAKAAEPQQGDTQPEEKGTSE